MMINKRLINTVSDSKKYIGANVFFQWCSLIANACLMMVVSDLFLKLYNGDLENRRLALSSLIALLCIAARCFCTLQASRMSCLSYKSVKKTLRQEIYQKLLRLGASYGEQIRTSEIVQVAVEGVDQLETYFGSYLPQFFYSMLAPLTLFVILTFVDLKAALVLLICVPMIPMAIVAVQKWAKKLLSKYWGQYTALGDTFLENLQGLTTLKIVQADEFKHRQMNEESEKFRKITMKVLTMQLNSITIMDLVAYGGAAAGMIVALLEFKAGKIGLDGCLLIILLSADFFIPMRQLGSFFHVAMNGMAASDKIFRLLDLDEAEIKTGRIEGGCAIDIKGLCFSYQPDREILHEVNLSIPEGSLTAIVGESGCGKSTLAAILMGRNKNYGGEIKIGGQELSEVSEASLMQTITYVSHQSTLFKGTVKDNLLMGKADARDEELWAVLERVNLAAFIRSENGLNTKLESQGSNFSGGQRQRLALARALLHDTPVYIFDEATSNIDVESENEFMEQVAELAKTKTVILISHRLANVVNADQIAVLEKGRLVECGRQRELLDQKKTYFKLWNTQQMLERYTAEGGEAA